MGPFDLLSEALIDILKEFSTAKQFLSPAALKEALVARQEVLSLLNPSPGAPTNGRGNGASAPVDKPGPLLPAESENSKESNLEPLADLKDLFLKILDKLGTVITGGYEKRFSELYRKTKECESLLSLIFIGDQVTQMLGELIHKSLERINKSNDFLITLSNDLHKMGEQLCSYQDYSRESYQINSNFNDDLLEHTNDVHRTFNLLTGNQDIHTIITSKLNMIAKAIQDKNKLDEVRYREADSKINELQNNLAMYKEEILQVKERTESLEKEMMCDELTQINNRRAYDLRIWDNLRRYHRDGNQFSLILIDIDHFKRINDNYGHKVGDSCLREVAYLIRSSIRQSDFLARYGGEELIAILDGSDASNARNVAEKIRSCIEKARFHFHDESISVTVSLGVTQVAPSDTDPDIPFMRVDEALYTAKNDGRNRVRVVTDLSFCGAARRSLSKRPAGRPEQTENL